MASVGDAAIDNAAKLVECKARHKAMMEALGIKPN